MSDQPRPHPANRLAGETSPYLLQHAHNPVDWYPWGPEALAKAKAEDKPIFLSIGYSACHWCHVMERESFENAEIAAIMNQRFVNIKVDREERPDLDNIYMAAVQALTGHGGWPMSVFLTPDLKPFFGGTYYPPADRQGIPGFPRVLLSVERAWKERRGEIANAAAEMTEQLRVAGEIPKGEGDLDASLLDGAVKALGRSFEPIHGGFGHSPKFPHPMDLRLLLRQHARTGDTHALHMVTHTLDKMGRGGIYDHLGGGFARYSTDERWLVPHFEKMLYDNALLTTTYLEAFQATRDPEYARIARETMDYVLGRMTAADGGFHATEDADSEGVEGRFYVWTLPQIREILGDERAAVFAEAYDVTEAGNWEHANILNLPRPLAEVAKKLGRDEAGLRADLAADRSKLLASRDHRIHPHMDTKILTSWNGLMIAALAEGASILDEPRYAEAAARASAFVLDKLRGPDGRLLRTFKDGQGKLNAYLDDYANFIDGLTRLFEATGTARWIEAAADLARIMIAEFHDAKDGGFFYVGQSHESLIVRQKDAYDNATPSGNAMAATALARLAALTGRADFADLAKSTLRSVRLVLEKAPAAAGQSLVALDFLLAPTREFAVIAGNDPAELRQALAAIGARFLPHSVVAPAPGPVPPALATLVPLLADRPAQKGQVTTYICEHFTCQAPVVGVEDLRAAVAKL
ncbi:thioredoxin domain-containing protein [Tundrisphaera sp. TA3]|uniref:thioredoxin domain-containing protein n=1 Tax=Tundrisphaera sp. TA3 TaxID=3435775 RepID=UPI003EBACF58